jgi:hypothetical protein
MIHTQYANKVFVLPAIKAVLKKGGYLGALDNLYGGAARNFYFADPVTLDGSKKIVELFRNFSF